MDPTPTTPSSDNTPNATRKQKKIHCKQELIVSNLQKFYTARTDMEEVMKYLLGTSTLSLRLIDWFVTNYSKRHNVNYVQDGHEFIVYLNYKSQLKAYSKKLFDPFCRRERIMFQIPGYESFVTTIGKLNFFRWAIEKGVLSYLKEHLDTIEGEMNRTMKEQTSARNATASTTASSTGSSTVVSAASGVGGANSTGSNPMSVASSAVVSRTSTRRRIVVKENPITPNVLQKHVCSIELHFD